MLKRLLVLALLAIPTPALAGGAHVYSGPVPQPHCVGQRIIVVGVPVRTRYRRPVTYSRPYIVPFYAPFYGNTYRGTNAAYDPTPAEPLLIENPFFKN